MPQRVDREEFKRLYAQGLSRPEIAQRLGISSSGVSAIRKKLGLPYFPRVRTPRDTQEAALRAIRERAAIKHAQIRELALAGQGPREIAPQVGYSVSWTQRIMQQLRKDENLDISSKLVDHSRPNSLFLRLYHEGKGSTEIAAALGVTPARVSAIRKELKLPRITPKPPQYRRVDPEELKRLHAEGKTGMEAAAYFGVRLEAVNSVRRKLGLPRFKHPNTIHAESRNGQIIEMIQSGQYLDKEIAEKLGVSLWAVGAARAAAGLTRKKPVVTQETLDRAHAMLKDGASYAEVARSLPISAHVARRRFPGYSWTREQRHEYISIMRMEKKYGLR